MRASVMLSCWAVLAATASLTVLAHSGLDQSAKRDTAKITTTSANELSTANEQNANVLKTVSPDENGTIASITEIEKEKTIPTVQGCAVFADRSYAACFVDTVQDEVPSMSLSEDINAVTRSTPKSIGRNITKRLGKASRVSLRASVAFCNLALKNLAASFVPSTAITADVPLEPAAAATSGPDDYSAYDAIHSKTSADNAETSHSSAAAGREAKLVARGPHRVECSIHLSDGTFLLQPHLFGPLIIDTDTHSVASNTFPHPDDDSDSTIDDSSKKSNIIFNVNIIGNPSGGSLLEVEESAHHHLLHVRNAATASTQLGGRHKLRFDLFSMYNSQSSWCTLVYICTQMHLKRCI